MTDLTQHLTRLLEQAERATPGPWYRHMETIFSEDKAIVQLVGQIDGEWEDDFDFIMEARTLVPALIKALQRALEGLEKVKQHGCCVMHSDARCPGCESAETLSEISALMGMDVG